MNLLNVTVKQAVVVFTLVDQKEKKCAENGLMFHCFKFLRDACLKSHQVVVAVFAHEGSAAVGSCRVGTVLTHYIPIGFGEECRGKHSYRDHGGKLWSYNSLKMYVKI